MSSPRIALLASQDRILRAHFASHPDGHERAAVVLFKRLSTSVAGLDDSDRYVAVAVEPFSESWVTSSSPSHVAFHTDPLREHFRRCEEENLIFGFVHSHPTGNSRFSEVDRDNELTLLRALANRNGAGVSLVALLWTTRVWKGRVRNNRDPEWVFDARHVIVTDRPMGIYETTVGSVADPVYARQAAAFGPAFVERLKSLRVAVVGAGGTGSAAGTLLARSGIGELVLVDPDSLEESNLNRVRGAALGDVGASKAKVLGRYIASLGLGTVVSSIHTHVDTPEGVDAIASADVIFGCTDDQIGREVLTVATYMYAQPYIDLGLGGQLDQDQGGQPYLRYHHGRISTLLPETGECLFCQEVLSESQIRREYVLRDNPALSDDEARERYIEGGLEQAPGIGPFTGAVADFGVATLYDLVSPFRRFPGELRWDAFSIDFVKMEFQSSAARNSATCPYCGTRDFLVLPETSRLNRPSLGTRRVAT